MLHKTAHLNYKLQLLYNLYLLPLKLIKQSSNLTLQVSLLAQDVELNLITVFSLLDMVPIMDKTTGN